MQLIIHSLVSICVVCVCVRHNQRRGGWRLDNLGLQIRTAALRSKGKRDGEEEEEEGLWGEAMWTPLDNVAALIHVDVGGRRRMLWDVAKWSEHSFRRIDFPNSTSDLFKKKKCLPPSLDMTDWTVSLLFFGCSFAQFVVDASGSFQWTKTCSNHGYFQ